MSPPLKKNIIPLDVADQDNELHQVFVIRAETSSTDAEHAILNGHWSITIYGTSGGPRYKSVVTDANVIGMKGRGNDMSDDEWSLLVYRILFSELQSTQRRNIFLDVWYEGGTDLGEYDGAVVKSLKVVRNPLMKQTIGVIPMILMDDDDDPIDSAGFSEFDLFVWMRHLGVQRDSLLSELEEEKTCRLEAEEKNKTAVQESLEFQQKMQQEKITQMKIYTVMMNNMKEAYKRALNGDDQEEVDMFNMDVLRSTLDEVKLDNSQENKKKLTRKKVDTSPRKKRVLGKKHDDLSIADDHDANDSDDDALVNEILAEDHKDEEDDEEEVIPDSQEGVSTSPKTKVKQEPLSSPTSPTKAQKAKSLTSLRFGTRSMMKEPEVDSATDVEDEEEEEDADDHVAGYELDEDLNDTDRTMSTEDETDDDNYGN